MTILDDLWLAAIANEIDAPPVDEDVPMSVKGKEDCTKGVFEPPCAMSVCFEDYIRAWEEAARQMTAEYADDIEDRVFWARGGW